MENFKEKTNFKKTGTTIAALKFKDGVLILADTRSTSGPYVANKHILKIQEITEHIYTAGAGTAADTYRVCKNFGGKLRIFEKKFERKASIEYFKTTVSNHLHGYGGYISAALICGGMDEDGPKIVSIQPHGSTQDLDYAVNGSGCYAAIGVLEAFYKKNLSKEEAIEIGIKTIEAGVMNDLYSGTGVDYVAIFNENGKVVVEKKRIELSKATTNLEFSEKYSKDSVKILKEDVFNLIEEF